MINFFRTSLLTIFIGILSFSFLCAQPDDPGGDPDDPIPFSGVEYLLLAGGALGTYRILKKKK